VLRSQSNRASFILFLSFIFPAYDLLDHNLVFFSCYIMKHAVLQFVKKKFAATQRPIKKTEVVLIKFTALFMFDATKVNLAMLSVSKKITTNVKN
jgi:hypothetical protein